jgi:hypothetical protein
MVNTEDELLELIRSSAIQLGGPYLTYNMFREFTGIPMSQVFRHFDSWTDACNAANIQPGQASPNNVRPNFSKGKIHALNEVRRIAKSLGVSTLSKSEFDKHNPEIRASTVAKLWSGWINVLKAANLNSHPFYHEEISIDVLAQEFLKVTTELNRIPTVNQLTRRSEYCKNTFTRKFGSYTNFKRASINHLKKQSHIPIAILSLLKDHLTSITPSVSESDTITPPSHSTGRILGFRAFAFAPTYETEVVSLFGSVAGELGFEIVAQREAFPDCEARRIKDSRRKRYAKCLIEYELRSSDYQKHKHPNKGCDLIVCWEHDWRESPIEVLELRSKIRALPGWK